MLCIDILFKSTHAPDLCRFVWTSYISGAFKVLSVLVDGLSAPIELQLVQPFPDNL